MGTGEIRVLQVGPGGHGQWHLRNLRRLRRSGFRLVGVHQFRPSPGDRDELIDDVPVDDDLPRLLVQTRPDITIVCTPMQTHAALVGTALDAGSAVLLEKPPTPTLADFDELLARAANGPPCQVGFQSLGSAAIPAVRDLVADGAIGVLQGIGGAGTWIREEAYFSRSEWAGHRTLDGVVVNDGVLTNPFAHALATALRLVDRDGSVGIAGIELDLYRAHEIEADDTSSLRLVTADGATVTVAATLCPEQDREPRLVVEGSSGSITLWYTQDEFTLRTAEGETTRRAPRVDLLENLAAHLTDPAVPLLVPLSSMRPFMQVMDEIATSPAPRVVPSGDIVELGAGDHRRLVVRGVDDAIERSVSRRALFRELGLSWAPAD